MRAKDWGIASVNTGYDCLFPPKHDPGCIKYAYKITWVKHEPFRCSKPPNIPKLWFKQVSTARKSTDPNPSTNRWCSQPKPSWSVTAWRLGRAFFACPNHGEFHRNFTWLFQKDLTGISWQNFRILIILVILSWQCVKTLYPWWTSK